MIKYTLTAMMLILAATSWWTWQQYQQAMTQPVVKDNVVILEIAKGESFNQISKKMRQQLAFKPLWFKVIAYQKKQINQLKAGEYRLLPGMTLPDILDVFVAGKSLQYSITFPEGWTFKQIRQRIDNNTRLRHTLKDIDESAILQKLGSRYTRAEGLFLPETYFFEKNSSDLELLKRAYDRRQQVLKQEWQNKQAGLPLKTPYEALILASIVEKETAVSGERAMIAGVFIRRLQKDMLLQTDPTVIYGMGEKYKGNIRRKDLKTPTAYNTYVIKGLPPTPIAMPGRDAIHAVLHPATGKSLYFVAKGDGTHYFSETLRQHVNAVNKYQKKQR